MKIQERMYQLHTYHCIKNEFNTTEYMLIISIHNVCTGASDMCHMLWYIDGERFLGAA